MDVARPPGPSGRVYGPAGEKVLAMYQRRLKEALEGLAWTGLEAKVVKTPEVYKGLPTLWIQVDMPVVQQRDLAHFRVLHAIHRAIAPAAQHQWWQDVLLHMWDTVVVVPTCHGRPWRPEGWVHSLWNMVTPPDSKDPVLNQRIFLPESLLTRLGFNMWDMNMAEEVNLLRAQLLEHHQQANRIREMERMLELSGVNESMVRQLLDAEEETLQQRVQEAFQLMTAHLGSMPGNAELVASPQVLLQREHLLTQRNFNEMWPLAVPQTADYRTLNAIEVLITLELRQLDWENRRINTLTQNTFQEDMWPTDFNILET